MQVFRKRNTAILDDIQKTCDMPTNILIIKEKKMTYNKHLFLHGHEKKSISSPKLEIKKLIF